MVGVEKCKDISVNAACRFVKALLLLLLSLTGVLRSTVPVVTFEDGGADSALQFLCHNGDPKNPRFATWIYTFCLAKIFNMDFFFLLIIF